MTSGRTPAKTGTSKARGQRPVVAFGPVMPGWGSWNWVGEDIMRALSSRYEVRAWEWHQPPNCDVLVAVKHMPSSEFLEKLPRSARVIYCPIDYFDDAEHIRCCRPVLQRCARIVIHCERLRAQLEDFAPVRYLDHPLKFITPRLVGYRPNGFVLWVGVWTNLEPVIEWVNAHPLPCPLRVLTNLEQQAPPLSAKDLGFAPATEVTIETWSESLQLKLMPLAKAALDIKGSDFRAQHKPPAKGLDFVASGLPLAMNPESSTAEHFARLGFQLASPTDVERWLSRQYWEETRRFGRRLRRSHSLARVAAHYASVIDEVLVEREPVERARRAPTPRVQDDLSSARTRMSSGQRYEAARRLAIEGRYEEAKGAYEVLLESLSEPPLQALVHNDLAVLAVIGGNHQGAAAHWDQATRIDPNCGPAVQNSEIVHPSTGSPPLPRSSSLPPVVTNGPREPVRVAILSFLFNWPSTGGGIVHTMELAQFLIKAGFDVRHFYVRHDPWGIGRVQGNLPFPSTEMAFETADWSAGSVQGRVRNAVAAFRPDHVIITDSWNFKPLLAEAVRPFPYILRLQASECLCPLNNVRLLPIPGGRFQQCGRHQLATPELCRRCIQERGQWSGALHRVERALSDVGTAAYDRSLREAFAKAEAVFVVNPSMAEMVSPYTERVVVSPAGMDSARFPWPWPAEPSDLKTAGKKTLFFAGLIAETIKGFHVLHDACALLWQHRQDFELIATGDPPGRIDAFTRLVGWQSQADLPRHLRAADICIVPAIAQEALGRTAVEAMAVGRPVIASRLGGLPFTVLDEATGLLCAPGDPVDLAAKIQTLLDDRDLRERLGRAGRGRFEREYRWEAIIERDYRPVLLPASAQ